MGILFSYINEHYPPKSNFQETDIPDLHGKVYIVTGANTGIGKAAVRALLSHDAKVYLAARSDAKAKTAIAELKSQTGKEAYFLKLDLSSFKSIEAAAKEFLSKENRLDTLYNNAGAMWSPKEWLTTEGYDWQFGCNVLGPFYFTKLLMPLMLDTAKPSPSAKVRIISSSSFTHRFFSLTSDDINYTTLRDGEERRKLSSESLYAQSKFADILYARELASRYGDQGIVSTCLNPGSIRTELYRHAGALVYGLLRTTFYPVEAGALTGLWAATSPEGADLNGKFLIPFARVGKAEPTTESPEKAKKLWDWLEEQVKDRPSI